MRRPLTIGQRSFETRKAANRFVKDLLYSQPLKVPIQEPHHAFLTALLSMHPRAEEKVGKEMNHFTVEFAARGGRCFCLTRIDGTKTDSLSMNACGVRDRTLFDIDGFSSESLAKNRHLLQCRRCQVVFERTNPCTPKRAPFRSS